MFWMPYSQLIPSTSLSISFKALVSSLPTPLKTSVTQLSIFMLPMINEILRIQAHSSIWG